MFHCSPTGLLVIRQRVIAFLGLWLLLAGCAAQPVIRTPLKTVQLPVEFQQIPIAMLDVIVIPHTPPDGAEIRLLSLPDEILVKEDDGWTLVPSPIIVPAAEVLLVSLRHAGLNIQPYPSVAAARDAGARFAILGVVRTAKVILEEKGFFQYQMRKAEAVVDLQASVLDLRGGKLVWTGNIRSSLQHSPGLYINRAAMGETGFATTAVGERRAHWARTLLAQAYYHVAVDLVLRVRDALRDQE